MLHGKHVMVRVGGGWDTLKGFLMKNDPDRVLQFTTLEQKILAFQKGSSVPDSVLSTQTAQPPTMDPLAAVNLLPSSSAPSSSTSSSSSSSTCNPPGKPSTPVSGAVTPRGAAQSPVSTPSLPRKATAPKKKLLQVPSVSPKTTALSSNTTKKSPVLQPRAPGFMSQKSPLILSDRKQCPRGTPSQPRSPVCPEPSCKQAKPSATPVINIPQRDGRPPRAPLRTRLVTRRPSSPAATRLQMDTRKGRPVSPRPAGLARTPKETKPLVAKASQEPKPPVSKTPREVRPSPVNAKSRVQISTLSSQVSKSSHPIRTKNPGGPGSATAPAAPRTAQTAGTKTTHTTDRKPQSSSNRVVKTNTVQVRAVKPTPSTTQKKQPSRTVASKKAEEPYFEMSTKKKRWK